MSQGGSHNVYLIRLTQQADNGQTLAAELQTQLTNIGYTPTVTFNALKQTTSISIETFNFHFLTDFEFRNYPSWNVEDYDKDNLQPANEFNKLHLIYQKIITHLTNSKHILIYNPLEICLYHHLM